VGLNYTIIDKSKAQMVLCFRFTDLDLETKYCNTSGTGGENPKALSGVETQLHFLSLNHVGHREAGKTLNPVKRLVTGGSSDNCF